MSETEALGSEGVEAEASPAVDGGQAAEASEQPGEVAQAAPEEQAPEYLPIDEMGERFVQVTVDGETLDVPLNEALQGYQRQEAFTRKTQELAEQRKQAEFGLRLQEALDTNPELTLQILAQQAGVPLGQQATPEATPEPEFSDPLERQLHEQTSRLATLEEQIASRDAEARLSTAISGLKQRYEIADDDTVRAVVAEALKQGVGPDSFDMIYRAQQYEKLTAQQQAKTQFDENRGASEAEREAAKTAANQVVGAGAGAVNTTTQIVAPDKPTLREAFESTWDEVVGGR